MMNIINILMLVTDKFVAFTTDMLIARKIGEKLFGDFSATLSALYLIADLLTFGVGSIIQYYIPKFVKRQELSHITSLSESIHKFIRPVNLIFFIITILIAFSILVLTDTSKHIHLFEVSHPVFLLLWSCIALSAIAIYFRYFISIGYTKTAISPRFIGSIIYLISVVLICILFQFTNQSTDLYHFTHIILLNFVVNTLIIALIFFLLYIKISSKFPKQENLTVDWKNKIYGYIVQGLRKHLYYTPLLILEYFGNNEHEVGILGAVLSITTLSTAIPATMIILFTPNISAMLVASKKDLLRGIQKYLIIFLTTSTVIAGSVYYFAEDILLLYKSQFISALPILHLYTIEIVTFPVRAFFMRIIKNHKNGDVIGAKLTIMLLLIQVTFGIPLAKFFGINGISVCYIGSNILFSIIIIAYVVLIYRSHTEDYAI